MLILFVYCFVSLSIMLLTWRAAQDYSNPVVWLMITGFIGTIIFTTHMASSGVSLLIFSGIFQVFLASSLLLFIFSCLKYLNYFSK